MQNVVKCLKNKVAWAKEAGVDFIMAETMSWLEEAKIALKVIKDADMIAVTNITIHQEDKTRDWIYS